MSRHANTRTKYWLFTAFADEAPQFDEERMGYMVYQRERCPNTNRLHWQGYVEFKSRIHRTRAIGLLNSAGIHLEPRRGSAGEAIQYCTKDETRESDPVYFGVPAETRQRPGSRTDLVLFKEALHSQQSLADVFESNFTAACKYYKFGIMYRNLINKRDTIPLWRILTVKVYYGNTGVGKTKRCYDEKPELFKLPMGDQQQLWFDGYEQEDTLLLDEFYSQIKFNFLLQLLDGYPLRLPIKGGHVSAAWSTVYITSQYHPQHWYPKISYQLKDHLMRRLTHIECIGEEPQPPTNPDYPVFRDGAVVGAAAYPDM